MVLIKGQAQFNYVKYYPIRSRWILIDQKKKKKFVCLLFLIIKSICDRNNKLSYIYVVRIADYVAT